jgi:hypothetical protein
MCIFIYIYTHINIDMYTHIVHTHVYICIYGSVYRTCDSLDRIRYSSDGTEDSFDGTLLVEHKAL